MNPLQSTDWIAERRISRRQALALIGAYGAGTTLLGWSRPARGQIPCVVKPEQTEGPYFVDTALNRSDIRSDPATGALSAGIPFDLRFAVLRITRGRCEPLRGAQVHVWHCDASGVYSGVNDGVQDAKGRHFLRGYQVSDENGKAGFRTIYPGWYPGRAVHVHFKIRVPVASGGAKEFTSQLYFDDALSEHVYRSAPYSRRGENRLKNAADGSFQRAGEQLTLNVRQVAGGYDAQFPIALAI